MEGSHRVINIVASTPIAGKSDDAERGVWIDIFQFKPECLVPIRRLSLVENKKCPGLEFQLQRLFPSFIRYFFCGELCGDRGHPRTRLFLQNVHLKKFSQSCFPAAWAASNLDLVRYVEEFNLRAYLDIFMALEFGIYTRYCGCSWSIRR
jgi:hypothetical protein